MKPVADKPKRRPYQITDEETWARVRQAYLGGGLTAKECADRFDVSVHALRKRADTEEWSKRAFVNAVGPSAPCEAQPDDPYVIRRVARTPTAQVVEVEEVETLTPADPGEMAEAAFARAAQAFAGGRTEEAGRLLKLAAAARKMADADAEQRAVEVAPAAPDARALADDEVAATIDQLFDATKSWAEEMLLHGIARLPAVLVARAAVWRALVLGEAAEDEDRAAAQAGGWADRVWTQDDGFWEPPTHARLARLMYGRHLNALPRMAQLPPD